MATVSYDEWRADFVAGLEDAGWQGVPNETLLQITYEWALSHPDATVEEQIQFLREGQTASPPISFTADREGDRPRPKGPIDTFEPGREQRLAEEEERENQERADAFVAGETTLEVSADDLAAIAAGDLSVLDQELQDALDGELDIDLGGEDVVGELFFSGGPTRSTGRPVVVGPTLGVPEAGFRLPGDPLRSNTVGGPFMGTDSRRPAGVGDPLRSTPARPGARSGMRPIDPSEIPGVLYEMSAAQVEDLQRKLISAGFLAVEPGRWGQVNVDLLSAWLELMAETQRRNEQGIDRTMEGVLNDLQGGGWRSTDLNDPDGDDKEIRATPTMAPENIVAFFQDAAVRTTGKPLPDSVAQEFVALYNSQEVERDVALQKAEGEGGVPGAPDVSVAAENFIRDRFPTQAKAHDIAATVDTFVSRWKGGQGIPTF